MYLLFAYLYLLSCIHLYLSEYLEVISIKKFPDLIQ